MNLDELIGIVAPAATMIAAMMTAANLGARVTGWGFVVFTVGSLCWSFVGASSGQTNLLATNIFLTLVNIVGIWRWLGRQREYEAGAETAAEASRRSEAPSLFPATAVAGMPVIDVRGDPVGHTVEAMVECATGRLSYMVIASGGVGGIDEALRPVPMDRLDCRADGLLLLETRSDFDRRDILTPDRWPASVPTADPGLPKNMKTGSMETASATA